MNGAYKNISRHKKAYQSPLLVFTELAHNDIASLSLDDVNATEESFF